MSLAGGQKQGQSVQAGPPLPALMLLPVLLLPVLWAGSLQEESSYWLQVQKSVVVQENLCALVPCSFSYPRGAWQNSTPTYGYWYRQNKNLFDYTPDELVATNNPVKKARMSSQRRFQLVGDPRAYNCSLKISAVQQGDSGSYYFRVERGKLKYSYPKWMVTVTVTAPPQNLTIGVTNASGTALDTQGNGSYLQVRKDQLLWLLCAADSRPPATLTWELGGRVVSQAPPSGPRPLRLELPRVKPEDAGRYTCRAESSLGSKHRSLDLSVQYPPEDLRVTVSQANSTVLEILRNGTSLPILEGQSLRLVCVTHSEPPATLSWARGTQALNPAWLSAPGVLELPQFQLEHEGEITCRAENPLGARSVSLRLSVHWKPECWQRSLWAALVGAGLAAVLALCACLVLPRLLEEKHTRATRALTDSVCRVLPSALRMQTHREQGRRKDLPPVPESIYDDNSYENWTGSVPCPHPAAGSAQLEEEQEEGYYTPIDF